MKTLFNNRRITQVVIVFAACAVMVGVLFSAAGTTGVANKATSTTGLIADGTESNGGKGKGNA